jgi:hypothetical protein
MKSRNRRIDKATFRSQNHFAQSNWPRLSSFSLCLFALIMTACQVSAPDFHHELTPINLPAGDLSPAEQDAVTAAPQQIFELIYLTQNHKT